MMQMGLRFKAGEIFRKAHAGHVVYAVNAAFSIAHSPAAANRTGVCLVGGKLILGGLFLCLTLGMLSGCSTLTGREVTLYQSRLTVLESHPEQFGAADRVGSGNLVGLLVKKCPQSVNAEELLRQAIGAHTNLEVIAAGSKQKSRDTLTVECTTAVERDGGPLGASRPAAIGLVATLANSNEVTWSARYFYRDKAVSSDVLAIKDRFQVGGGGMRFAALPELAHSGLVELMQELGRARSAALLRN